MLALGEKNYKSILQSGIKFFKCIKYSDADGIVVNSFKENKKLKELFQILIKLDTEFYSKLRNILKKYYFDYITTIKESLSNLVYKRASSHILVDK